MAAQEQEPFLEQEATRVHPTLHPAAVDSQLATRHPAVEGLAAAGVAEARPAQVAAVAAEEAVVATTKPFEARTAAF